MRASRGLSFTSAIAVGLSAMVLLGACTPEETEPTPSASPTVEEPTPTPTPTTPPEAIAPERPAEMAEISVAGAEAAATYFLQLYPYVYATGDLAEWASLSHPECLFCASVIQNVGEQVAAGNSSSGAETSVEILSAIDVSPSLYSVSILATQAPSIEVSADGAVVSESDGGRYLMDVLLVPSGETWLIRGVDYEDAPPA